MDLQTDLLYLNELYFHSKRPERQDHLISVLDMCYTKVIAISSIRDMYYVRN